MMRGFTDLLVFCLISSTKCSVLFIVLITQLFLLLTVGIIVLKQVGRASSAVSRLYAYTWRRKIDRLFRTCKTQLLNNNASNYRTLCTGYSPTGNEQWPINSSMGSAVFVSRHRQKEATVVENGEVFRSVWEAGVMVDSIVTNHRGRIFRIAVAALRTLKRLLSATAAVELVALEVLDCLDDHGQVAPWHGRVIPHPTNCIVWAADGRL